MSDKREHDPGRDPLLYEIEHPGDVASMPRKETIDARRFRPRIIETRPCHACGAMIHLLKTHNDRKAPVDCVPRRVALHDIAEGTNQLYNASGHNVRMEVGEIGFMSHFATCPHADRFRKKRPAKKEDPLPSPEVFGKRLSYMEQSLERLRRSCGKADKPVVSELYKHAKRTREIFERNRAIT